MNTFEKKNLVDICVRIARFELDLNRFEAEIFAEIWKTERIEAQKRREYQV